MIKLKLTHSEWNAFRSGNTDVWFSGYFYFENYLIQSAEELWRLIENMSREDQWINTGWIKNNLLPNVNGNYAVVIHDEVSFFAATDMIRSIPLYVKEKDNLLFVYDNLSDFPTQRVTLNEMALEQFVASRFVYNQRTVYMGVTSIGPGEWVSYKKNTLKLEKYFSFVYDIRQTNNSCNDDLISELDEILSRVFKRMLESSREVRNWVVPLSGGHDSRIIVNYLHKLGVKNVICFSYGNSKSEQARISRQVADALGYQWHFCEYTADKWFELHQNGILDRYISFAFNGESQPHLQDFLAIYQLKQEGLLNTNDVIVPGHALDFLAGSHLLPYIFDIEDLDEAVNQIIRKFSSLWQYEYVSGRIRESVKILFENSSVPYTSWPELFNWENRQVKYIGNSIRTYEFFGYRWRLPFWEKEIVDFWLQIDANRRKGRKLYLEAEKELLTEDLEHIPFAGEKINKKISIKPIKSKIRRYVPEIVKVYINRFLKKRQISDEAVNLIYMNKEEDVEALIGPLEQWPDYLLQYFRSYLKRYTYQTNPNALTVIYTLKVLLMDKITEIQ